MTTSIETLYSNLITDVDAQEWQNISDSGAALSNFSTIPNLQADLIANTTDIFYMKAIK
jgi:hypothetical protein